MPPPSSKLVSQALERYEARPLQHVVPGSWINANFDIWIGAAEDNQAWELLPWLVNDTLEAQMGLCEALGDLGVIPYYLHQLDRVAGAAHFEVAEETGRALMHELRRALPGYAVPRYVRETPGGQFKEIID